MPRFRYRFRCCRKGFCSPQCFSKHEECLVEDNKHLADVQISSNRRVRVDNFDLDLEESENVSDDTYAMISSDESVRAMLADPVLQKLLLKLDNSRDRRYTFSKMYDSNDLFRSFVDTIATIANFNAEI